MLDESLESDPATPVASDEGDHLGDDSTAKPATGASHATASPRSTGPRLQFKGMAKGLGILGVSAVFAVLALLLMTYYFPKLGFPWDTPNHRALPRSAPGFFAWSGGGSPSHSSSFWSASA